MRRSEVAALTLKHIQTRDNRWCIVDLVGKRGGVRAIPMPTWVKGAIDAWTAAAGLTEDRVLRPMGRGDQLRGERLTENSDAMILTLAPRLRPFDDLFNCARLMLIH